jgi:hypothetical protein
VKKNVVIASATSSSFVKETEIPLGSTKWLRIVAPDEQDGTELFFSEYFALDNQEEIDFSN